MIEYNKKFEYILFFFSIFSQAQNDPARGQIPFFHLIEKLFEKRKIPR